MVKLHAIGNSEQFIQLQNKNARIVNYDQDLTTGSKGYLPSRARRQSLASRSKMPDSSDGWGEMKPEQVKSWQDLGNIVGGTSWQNYLKNVQWDNRKDPVELGDGDFGVQGFGGDNAAMPTTAAPMANYALPGVLGRMNYGMVHYGGKNLKESDTPDVLWAGLCSRFFVDASNRTVEWHQLHPQSYTIRKLMGGGGKVYRNYDIEEVVTLPLQVAFSYCCYMETAGTSPGIEAVVQLDYDNNGNTATAEYTREIGLQANWLRLTIDIPDAPGAVIGYRIGFRFTDTIAMLLIDRLRCYHTGANWAIDPECEDMQFDLSEIYKNALKPWGSPDDGLYTYALSTDSLDVPLQF